MTKNGGRSKQDFETFKSVLCSRSPFEWGKTLGTKERSHRQDYTRVAINKTAIRICKSKKNLDIGDRVGKLANQIWWICERGP